MMKYSQEKFSGKFEGIRAKIFRTPKNLPAPTPMYSFNLSFYLTTEFYKTAASHTLTTASRGLVSTKGVVFRSMQWNVGAFFAVF